MAVVELHLEGTKSAVIWHTPEDRPHAPPPRVVMYEGSRQGDGPKVWLFYRFTQPRMAENRAGWYRIVEPLRLAPGEYRGGE